MSTGMTLAVDVELTIASVDTKYKSVKIKAAFKERNSGAMIQQDEYIVRVGDTVTVAGMISTVTFEAKF